MNQNLSYMKNFIVFLLLLCGMSTAVTLNAQSQSVQTVQATVSAGGNAEHFYAAVGQPFFQQNVLGNYELSLGVAQAQWTRDTVYDVITYNTPYTDNGFNMPAQTTTHKDSTYLVNGGIYNYDLLRTLYLIVCPEKVTDAFSLSIDYDVLAVTGHCWTKQNLRSPVSDAMSYTCALYPTVPENYGLLYTWNTAINNTTADADGYVQGICPNDKWHLPNAEEVNALISNPIEALRSEDGWVSLAVSTNATGFTAYPAGCYNAATSRFEGLTTQTDWWTMINPGSGSGTTHKTSLEIPCHCYSSLLITRDPNDAISVRCVMKNEWPE